MTPPPDPIKQPSFSRASIAGLVLAVAGIGAFIVLWLVLGRAGLASAPRLFTSLCLPPLLLAVLLGVYLLVQRSKRS